MITNAVLEELQDEELEDTIALAKGILKKRDDLRKAEAMEQARALRLKAQSEARALLATVGLSLKDVNHKRKHRGARYQSGRLYRHPAKAELV